MRLKSLKYFSTLLVLAVALAAGWWLWNFYMQAPWTRDGKVRAEQVSITPQVSGSITELNIKDNQLVKAGDILFRIDDTPYKIAVLNAQAQLARRRPICPKPTMKPTVAAICRKLYLGRRSRYRQYQRQGHAGERQCAEAALNRRSGSFHKRRSKRP
jgi:hypothetical protein